MPVPNITPLPTPPVRSDAPTDFSAKADAFVAALPVFGGEANQLADFVDQRAIDAYASAQAAANSANSAAGATTKASQWADAAENVEVEPGKFSALHQAIKAAGSATSATGSAATATTKAAEASTSAATASTKAGEAAASATAAAQDAQAVADALASIADGPVTSVAGQTGVVTLALLRAGGVATQEGAETLSNKTMEGAVHTGVIDQTGSVRANVVALAANTLNCSLGNYFTRTISANSTFAFSNVPASRAYSCTLEISHTAGAITWPASVRWPSDMAPTLTTGKTHLFIFVTDDGGVRWRGAALVDYTN